MCLLLVVWSLVEQPGRRTRAGGGENFVRTTRERRAREVRAAVRRDQRANAESGELLHDLVVVSFRGDGVDARVVCLRRFSGAMP